MDAWDNGGASVNAKCCVVCEGPALIGLVNMLDDDEVWVCDDHLQTVMPSIREAREGTDD